MMWMYRVDSTDVLRRSVIKRETWWNGFENKSCISVNSFCDSKNNRYEEKQHFVRFGQYLHKSPELIIMGYTKKKICLTTISENYLWEERCCHATFKYCNLIFIFQLKINMLSMDLTRDARETLEVRDCGETNICNRHICKNGGTCLEGTALGYRCSCPASYTGEKCEVEINLCLTQQPCRNNGVCSVTSTGYRCDCPLGFMGKNCEAGNMICFVGDLLE